MAGSWRSVPSAIVLSSLMAAATVAFAFAREELADPIATFAANFVIYFVISVFFSTTLGLAWHHFAMQRGWRGALAYLIPALIVGILASSLLLILAMIWSGQAIDLMGGMYVNSLALIASFSVPLSSLTGLLFWLIRRPDRDPPNPDRATP